MQAYRSMDTGTGFLRFVLQALLRAVTHTNYHLGQIVDLARTRTAEWKTLSIPRPAGK